MKRIFRVLLLLTLINLVFVACKKYPEGPTLSFRTKSARLENSWKITKYLLNGEDKTSDAQSTYYKDYVLSISKSGSYNLSYSFFSIPLTETGKWVFADDKRQVVFTKESGNTVANNGESTTWTILKLKENEMQAQQIQTNGDLHVIHLETK